LLGLTATAGHPDTRAYDLYTKSMTTGVSGVKY